METTPLKGFARFRAAWQNSLNGLADMWRSEEAFRLEAKIFIVSIPVAFWLGETVFEVSILCGVVFIILIVEVLNTAIEAVVDRIGSERHELSRIAKDLGSLAVVMAAILAGSVWIALIADRLTS